MSLTGAGGRSTWIRWPGRAAAEPEGSRRNKRGGGLTSTQMSGLPSGVQSSNTLMAQRYLSPETVFFRKALCVATMLSFTQILWTMPHFLVRRCPAELG